MDFPDPADSNSESRRPRLDKLVFVSDVDRLRADTVGTPHLEIVAGPYPRGRKIERLRPGTTTLGRGLGVGLLFDVDGVSRKHAKFTFDATHLNGASINSSALDISPGDTGWLFRSQIQFAF